MGKFVHLDHEIINIENINQIEYTDYMLEFEVRTKDGKQLCLNDQDGLRILIEWTQYLNDFLKGDHAHE